MAIIEPQKEKFSFGPLILMGVLVLFLAGIGFGVYAFIGGPKPKTIKLSEADAKKVSPGIPNTPVPPGPPFPVVAALPQSENPQATMITLDLKNVTVGQAVAELGKQANTQIIAPQQGGPSGFLATLMAKRFDFAVANQPFWGAMDELSKKAQVFPNPWEQRNPSDKEQPAPRIMLQSGGNGYENCPTQDIGACRLVLTGVTSRFNADPLNARPANRTLTVALMLYVEPKVGAYRIAPVATIDTAVDEKGGLLIKPRDPWDDRNNGGPRSRSVSRVECKLQMPANAGDRIAKLKGYASVVTVGKDETITIKDPLKAVNLDKNVDGQPIRIKRVAKQGPNRYEAQMTADGNSPLFKDWESLQRVAKLYDANGKEFPHGGTGMGGSNKTVDFYLYYNGTPDMSEPAEMRITIPTKVKEIRVPFEFTDLPLPH